MAAEWTTFRLGDVCLKIGSGATPRGGSSVYLDQGEFALIRSQNIYNDGFHREGIVYLTAEHAAALGNVEVEEGDVLLNITGDSVARSCEVDPAILPARVNQHVAIIRPDPTVLWPRFLRYFLVTPAMQAHMLSLAGAGATRNALTKGMIESFEVLAPSDLDEQRAIAHILGVLDDKIELNRRRNETLEAMARALFKDWFVDFGPVRAKMEGREPYLPPDLWQLFPDRLDEEGKPEGWEFLPFGELLDGTIGGDWGKEQAETDHDQAVCIIRGTDIPDLVAGSVGKVPTRYTTKKKLTSRILQDGDIAIEVSGGSPTQPTGRSLRISNSILKRFDHPVVCASFCRRFRPRNPNFGLLAAYHLANLYRAGGTWEYQNQSTGISNFQTTHFLQAERVLIPDEGVQTAFAYLVGPIVDQTKSNENISLGALRDELLPKLISGDLRIEAAEKFLETRT